MGGRKGGWEEGREEGRKEGREEQRKGGWEKGKEGGMERKRNEGRQKGKEGGMEGGKYLVQPFARTVSFFNSYFVSSVRLWNSLPNEVALCNNISSFKSNVRSIYLS